MSEILKKGSKGEGVRKLQQDLVNFGYKVNVDGDFGPATEEAVKNLQSSFGYTVDGKVGDGTQFLLKQQAGYGWKQGQPTTPTQKQ